MKKLLPFITMCILSLTSYGQANPESSGFDNSLGAVTFAVNQKINMNFAFGQNGSAFRFGEKRRAVRAYRAKDPVCRTQ